MTTGEKIAECRKNSGFTQKQLAEELGVTRQAVSRWESDLAFPETDTLLKMSKLFGVTCDWLLNYNSSVSEAAPPSDKERGRGYFDLRSLHIEYKSKTRIGKLPLVHINIGFGQTAKGVFAVGLKSVGIFSVGLLSLGVVSVGTLGLGLFSFSCLALGLFTMGAFAVGLIAFGAVAIGLLAMGAVALGLFAVGAYANGVYVAIGDIAEGFIALGKSSAHGTFAFVSDDWTVNKSEILKRFEELPKIWSAFTAICRNVFELVLAKW